MNSMAAASTDPTRSVEKEAVSGRADSARAGCTTTNNNSKKAARFTGDEAGPPAAGWGGASPRTAPRTALRGGRAGRP